MADTEQAGLKRISKALNQIHRQRKQLTAQALLENTAGQGTNLGWKFSHLQAIIEGLKAPERVGICIDTCHAFAAGYAMDSAANYRNTFEELDEAVGLDKVRAFHLNDSKKAFGSRVDRHEHIGRGEMGDEPFRRLLKDKRFQNVPMYLETPKEELDGEEGDIANLARLHSLTKRSTRSTRSPSKSKASGK